MERSRLRRARGRLAPWLWAALLGGCLFGGGGPERVLDPEIVGFGERIDAFYRSLENTPLDVRSTFESRELRDYFQSEEDFASYYASLVRGARRALLRNATALRVDVDQFRFETEDVAIVQVRLVGRHTRRLRPGDVEIERSDTWKRSQGRWYLSPEKL